MHPPERSAYLVRVVKRFSVTLDRGGLFIPEDKRVGSNEPAGIRDVGSGERKLSIWSKKPVIQ